MSLEITIPRETVNDNEVIIASLLVEHGARVKAGQLVAEIETSKANVSIEAGADGFIQWQVLPGETVSIAAAIGAIHPRIEDVGPLALQIRNHTGSDLDCAAESVLSDGESSPSPGNDPLISRAARLSMMTRTVERGPLLGERDFSAGIFTPPSEPRFGFVSSVCYDLYRYRTDISLRSLVATLYREPGFQASFIYRAGRASKGTVFGRVIIFPIFGILQRRLIRRYGIALPFEAVIGAGINFPHWGGIWINGNAKIGINVTIGHDVSIGTAGPDPTGHPQIGDNVYLSTGCRITGDIQLGKNVMVAANSLVMRSVPDGSIQMGVPAKEVGTQSFNKYAQQIHPDLFSNEDAS